MNTTNPSVTEGGRTPAECLPRIVPREELPPLEQVSLVRIQACNLCGSHEHEVLLSTHDWSATTKGQVPLHVLVCARCGLFYLRETLPKHILEYPGKHGGSLLYGMPLDKHTCQSYFDHQLRLGRQAAQWVSQIVGSIEGWRHLDVLCGAGGVLAPFKEMGAQSQGIEPSADLSRVAAERTASPVLQALLDTAPRKLEGSFQLVSAALLLNHYLDPTHVLTKLRSLLRPDGYLYLCVDNFLDGISRKPIRSCVHVDHPHMFTPTTLRAFLAKTGFEIVAFEAAPCFSYDFHTTKFVHAICRLGKEDPCRRWPESALLDAKLAYLNHLSLRFTDHLDALTPKLPHYAAKPHLLKRLERSIRKRWRRAG